LAEERALVWHALPDLRKKRGPAALGLEDEPVLAGADLAHQVRFVRKPDRPGRGKERDLDFALRPLGRAQFREARIAERRRERVFGHVLRERPRRLEAADAAAQLAILQESDERGPGALEPRGI